MALSPESSALRYVEPPRGFGTSIALAVFMFAVLGLDIWLGTGVAHLLLWAVAFVIVVGSDLATTVIARRERSLIVRSDQVSIGPDVLLRSDIDGLASAGAEIYRVLGRGLGAGVPRGKKELRLSLADGSQIIVPTRSPDRVLRALGLSFTEDLSLRPASGGDAERIAEIDERAEVLFTVAGYPPLPTVPALDLPELVTFVAGQPAVGSARLVLVDDAPHLEELSVLPSHMRRGLGSALLSACCDWAAAQGYASLTLTTFADVPWNGPFYRARGFAEVTSPAAGMAALRAHEVAHGLDEIGARIVMARQLQQ